MTITGLKYIKASNETPVTLPVVTGTDSLAIGAGASVVDGTNCIAIGDSYATGTYNIVINNSNNAEGVIGNYNIIIGSGIIYPVDSIATTDAEGNILITSQLNPSELDAGTTNSVIIGTNTIGRNYNDCFTMGIDNDLADGSDTDVVLGWANLNARPFTGQGDGVAYAGSGGYNTILGSACAINAEAFFSCALGFNSGIDMNGWGSIAINGGIAKYPQSSALGFDDYGQYCIVPMDARTTDATPTVMETVGNVGTPVIPYPNHIWAFELDVAASRCEGTTSATKEVGFWKFKGVLKNTAQGLTPTVGLRSNVLTLHGLQKELIHCDDPVWDVNVAVDTTDQSLQVTVEGKSGKIVRWLGTLRYTELYSEIAVDNFDKGA